MEALRSIDTPAVRRVCAAAAATTSRERADLLAPFVATPRGWHPLFAEPGVAVALATEVADWCGRLCRQRSSWSATGMDVGVHGRAFSTVCAVITEGARRCAAADDALMDTLVAGLEASSHINGVLRLMCADFGGVYVTMMGSLVGCVCDAALKHPVAVLKRELAGCDGSGGPGASAAGGNAYAVARARVSRLASSGPLLRWSIELERVGVIRALACQVGMTANNSTSPREGQQVWAALAPRQLLSAVPGVLKQLLEAIGELTATGSVAFHVPFVSSMLSLHRLAHVDPPRLRALSQVPSVMAAAATYLEDISSLLEEFTDTDMATTILPALALYAPGHGAAMAECEELLTHLVGWAVGSPWPPVEEDLVRIGPVLAIEQVTYMAASLLLYIAREALRTGCEALPPAFRTRAARAGWRRLAATPDQPALAAVGVQLEALADSSTRSSAAVAAAPFPADAAALVERLRRCWTCGCPCRQPFDPYPIHRRDLLLRKCSACKVAVYCASACSSAGWGAGHRSACAGWLAYATAAAARGGGGGAAVRRGSVGFLRVPGLAPFGEDLSGDWKTDWRWTVTVAARVLEAGLALTDVVVVVEPGIGTVEVVPALEYAHRPDAVAAEMLTAATAKHGGRVLRVVVRQHPPLLRSYGPRSLQLDP